MKPEITEALKNNLATLRGMGGELRRAMESMDKKDFIFLLSDGTWDKANPKQGWEYEIYRLRQDYEPEPESDIIECEIKQRDGHKCFNRGKARHSLACAIDEADFIGFKFEDGSQFVYPIMYEKPDGDRFTLMKKVEGYTVLHATHVLFERASK